MSVGKWRPTRSLQECHAIITEAGQLHEMEYAVIDGRVYRVYKNLWPSIREYWRTNVTEKTEVHDQDYLVFESTRITYGQVDAMVQRMASILREVYGVRKGDRVGIAMRNYPEWVITFWAAGILGAIPTAFNAWLPIEPFLHCINLTTPKVLVLDAERLAPLISHLSSLHLSVILVHPSSTKHSAGHRVKEWSRVMSSYGGSVTAWKKESEAVPEDNATLFFTSGTTGLPKGVLSTQRAVLGNALSAMVAPRRRELRNGTDLPPPVGQGPPQENKQLASLIVVPLFHVTASLSQMLPATAFGSKLVLMRKWDKELAGRLIREESVTSTAGVPAIFYDLFESSVAGNTQLEGIGIGGAPAPDSFPLESAQRFPNARLQQGYGLTETNSLSASVVGEDYLERPSSTGLPPPTIDLLVVDPHTNKVLPTGEIGELWIRGPNTMRGYYNNQKATEEVITRDGWFKSGDLAYIDKEGFVYIKDRVKDMIIRGGENIHSVTVENALFSDPRILDCAVVGIPDKRLGELVTALVVLRAEWAGKVGEDDILEKIKHSLPAYAIPSLVVIQADLIERNAAGKTLKKEIRKQLLEEWEKRHKARGRVKL
ncbi:acetyl-CoA synthetase-like protein [Ramaria rubella]|nr:acetyl-CoA synthetase-like protein [Ramaria rubella]